MSSSASRSPTCPTASLTAFLYLTFVGSLLAFSVFAWLVRVAPLPKVTTYAYVNPVVAVILGAVVLSEPITTRTIIGGGIVIAAVALIVTARGREGRTTTESPAEDTDPIRRRSAPRRRQRCSRSPSPRPGPSEPRSGPGP